MKCKPSKEPGHCFACRHANQNTIDFEEGLVYCHWRSGDLRTWKSPCEELVDGYYLFEPWNLVNGTDLTSDHTVQLDLSEWNDA